MKYGRHPGRILKSIPLTDKTHRHRLEVEVFTQQQLDAYAKAQQSWEGLADGKYTFLSVEGLERDHKSHSAWRPKLRKLSAVVEHDKRAVRFQRRLEKRTGSVKNKT